MLVILDSSMLILPFEKKINITFELERIIPVDFEIVIPEIIIMELKSLLEESSPSSKQKAQFALKLAEKYAILNSKTNGNADFELERLAEEHNAIIATNDTALRLKLRKKGLPVISLHGNNRLSLFGFAELAE